MNYVRRVLFSSGSDQAIVRNSSRESPHLDIASADLRDRKDRKRRERVHSASNSESKAKRRKTESSNSSWFSYVTGWFGMSSKSDILSDSEVEDDVEIIHHSRSRKVTSPRGKFALSNMVTVDLTQEDSDDSEEVVVLSSSSVGRNGVSPFKTPQSNSILRRRATVTKSTATPANCTFQSTEVLSANSESDDCEVVAVVHNSPGTALQQARKSAENAMNEVICLSSGSSLDRDGAQSPATSDSVSIVSGSEDNGLFSDCTSPAPEDSVSREQTPKGFYKEACASSGDRWVRSRRPTSRFTSLRQRENNFSKEKAVNRFIGRLHDQQASPINLLARDRFKALLAQQESGAEAQSSQPAAVQQNRAKPPAKLKRLQSSHDYLRRTREAMKKWGTGSTPSGSGSQSPIDLVSSSASSSRSATPCSMVSASSAGRDRLDDMISLLRSVELRGPDALKQLENTKNAAAARLAHEVELGATSRICDLSRKVQHAEIEEKVRQSLILKGIRLPKPKPKAKDEFPALPEEAVELCERVWGRGSDEELFADGFTLKITRKDLRTISGLNWLNDEVINFYLQLVCDRSQKDDTLPKAYAFNTFFYASLSTKGYALVKRWTRKVDIFSFELLFVPVHVGSTHWCMAVIDFAQKRIDYYDSLHGRNKPCLDNLRDYLEKESMDKKKVNFDFTGWSFNLISDGPEQLNGSDCGMFSCKTAEFISRRRDLVFNQGHMPYFRKRMVYEIVQKQLL